MISKATLTKLDPIVRKVSGGRLYTSYELSEEEFVGELRSPVMKTLLDIGYESLPKFMGISLEAAKTHPDTNRVHAFSARKVDPVDYRKQFHVHGFPSDTGYIIASHLEYRPDLCRIGDETYADMVKRLRTHSRPDWSTSEYQRGVTDSALERVINE